MYSVHERVMVGSENVCRSGGDDLAVVHACKNPCHQKAVGYSGNPDKSHPNYLSLKNNYDLYLNMIDPPVPLFPDDLFRDFMAFARQAWESGAILLIHCNQGESRAPSLAMIFLAKHVKAISNESFEHARQDFVRLFRHYVPGGGIEQYLSENWRKLDAF